MKKPDINIDVDGVLADFYAYVFGRVIGHLGLPLNAFEGFAPTQWDALPEMATYVGLPRAAIEEAVHFPGFCLDMPLVPGARELVHRLRGLGNLHVVTTAWKSPYWHAERLEWLHHHLGFERSDVTFTHQKYRVVADEFIDDRPSHCMSWFTYMRKLGRNSTPYLVCMNPSVEAELLKPDYATAAPGWSRVVRQLSDIADDLESRRAHG